MKKKLSENKQLLNKTGGGPFEINKLNNIEELTVTAAGLEPQVDGLNVPSYGVGKTSGTINTVTAHQSQINISDEENDDQTPFPPPKSRKLNKVGDEFKIIQEFYKEISTNMKTLVDISNKRLEIEKRRLEIEESKFNLKY